MKAIAGGHFNRSLVPVYREDGSLALDHEEFPRPQTTLEGLAAGMGGHEVRVDAAQHRLQRDHVAGLIVDEQNTDGVRGRH